MSIDYSAIATSALTALRDAGQTVLRRSYAVASYDPSTGTATPTYADTSRTGAIFSFGAGKTTERGNLIEADDKRIILDAVGGGLTMRDKLIVGDVEYSIVSFDEVSPAGTPVIYDVHARS